LKSAIGHFQSDIVAAPALLAAGRIPDQDFTVRVSEISQENSLTVNGEEKSRPRRLDGFSPGYEWLTNEGGFASGGKTVANRQAPTLLTNITRSPGEPETEVSLSSGGAALRPCRGQGEPDGALTGIDDRDDRDGKREPIRFPPDLENPLHWLASEPVMSPATAAAAPTVAGKCCKLPGPFGATGPVGSWR
jgi:hypothetical protein